MILGGEQMSLQIHESVGHAVELDRILGWEAGYAGTSWLELAQLGRMRYGSELMNITADPTLPGALGEGRFAAPDFLREVQGLAGHFDTLRVDGEDYRHRGLPQAPPPVTDEAVVAGTAAVDGATCDEFEPLLAHLSSLHPSRYGALVDDVPLVGLVGVGPVADQSAALRLVVLADRLYDREIPVLASGVPFDRLFSEDMLRGGYRKKYYRAISRLTALAREEATG